MQPKQFKLPSCKQTLSIKLFLAGCMLASALPALSQPPLFTTKQNQLFKEAYRLAVPQNVLTYPWMSPMVDYDNDGSLDVILYGHHSKDAFIWRGAAGTAEY